METEKAPLIKPAMNYGVLIGLVLVIYSILVYVLGLTLEKWVGYITYPIIFGAIFFVMIKYRTDFCNGFITYGNAFTIGALSMVFASIISSFYSYIFFKFIDPSITEQMLKMAEQQMIEQYPDMTDEQIETALSFSKKFMSPEFMFFAGILGTSFMGVFMSLIAAIFAKKKDNSFDANFQQ